MSNANFPRLLVEDDAKRIRLDLTLYVVRLTIKKQDVVQVLLVIESSQGASQI